MSANANFLFFFVISCVSVRLFIFKWNKRTWKREEKNVCNVWTHRLRMKWNEIGDKWKMGEIVINCLSVILQWINDITINLIAFESVQTIFKCLFDCISWHIGYVIEYAWIYLLNSSNKRCSESCVFQTLYLSFSLFIFLSFYLHIQSYLSEAFMECSVYDYGVQFYINVWHCISKYISLSYTRFT